MKTPISTRRRLGPALIAAIALALATASWFGLSWMNTAGGDTLAGGRARDAALIAGQQAITVFNTLDYHDAAAGLDRWEQSSTGALLDQIRSGRAQSTKAIQDAKTTTTGKVIQAALSSFDVQAGKAQIIAVVETAVTPVQGQAVTKRNRFLGQLDRDGDTWKLSSLQAVPIGQ
jgi:Mce-associated membrane protein